MKDVDAILASDWHLRDSVPGCRTDDFEKAQWDKVEFVSALQKKHNCIVLHAGDLFDNWKPSPYLLSKTIQRLPAQFYTIYGNHDLPQHSLELVDKCGIYTLEAAGVLKILPGCHWGEVPDGSSSIVIRPKGNGKNIRTVLVWHTMAYQGTAPFPGAEGKAAGILRKHPQYDLILTGHNHQSFNEYGINGMGGCIVNPGGLTRQKSDEDKKEPSVYLYHGQDNTVTRVILPHTKGVVVKPESAIVAEERNARIDSFISKLKENWTTSLDFEANVERAIQANKVPKNIEQIIRKYV